MKTRLLNRDTPRKLANRVRDNLGKRVNTLSEIRSRHELPFNGGKGGRMIDGTALDGFPEYIAKQEAVLIGTVENGQLESDAAYYVHSRGEIALGEYDQSEDRFIPKQTVELGSSVMSDTVRALLESGVEVTLSPIGEALSDAVRLSEDDLLGKKQAHVYALREIHGYSRGETATILNVSPSTVDTQLYNARDRKNSAESFVDTLDQIVSDMN
ncbi:sigma-70 family RNA polymerase sigma factor [Halorubrum sp. Atlit-8R]|nr:sigma-70 family RNA polymerase sigma factor [Halorubrum sp. Atlit-9R]RLM81609.1 sigma-70 family RNA polymerase sigma factor [Halorubrum sp. Atlit-8R]